MDSLDQQFMSVKAIGLMLMSTMKQAMVSLFIGDDGSLSLSLHTHTHNIDNQTNLEREKNLTLNCAFGFYFI